MAIPRSRIFGLPRAAAIFLVLASAWSVACSRFVPADTLYRRAEALLRNGKLEAARSAADAGYRVEPSWRFRLLEIDILLRLDPRKALDAVTAAGEPTTAELRARLERDRGWASYLLSDYTSAKAYLKRAKELSTNLASPQLSAQIDGDRGILFAQQGDFVHAEENLRAALKTAEQAADTSAQIRVLGNLGWFFLFTHHPEEAIYWLERQRDAAAGFGAEWQLANAVGNLGSAYYRLGDYDQALSLLKEAERRFGEFGDRHGQQVWLGNIGNVLLDTSQYDLAAATYTRALNIARDLGDTSWIAWWEYDLASVYTRLGRFDEAERHNNEALRLKQSIASPDFYPLVNQAEIASGRGNFALAQKLYRNILNRDSDDPKPRLDAESGLADVLVKTGQISQADAQFRAGIERVQRRADALTRDDYKLSYFSSLINFDQRYVDFLVDRGQPGRAAEIAEAARARLLDERLNASGKSAPALTIDGFRRLARTSHAVILSYWLAPRRSFLWVITPEGVTLHTLPPEAKIAALVESYRMFIENLRDPLQSEFRDARKLSEILLGPVLPVLRDGVRLIVVPDGALNSINFETLPDPADPSHYLIERATVAVAPSLDLWAAPRRAQPTRGILLIGDPQPAVEEYPQLPYASREIDLIARNFAPGQTTRLEGPRAFPAAYRAADPARFSSIHFAAHASANRESPLDSALILSRHDGVYALSAREVMEIPLHADLVTLSACRGAGAKTYSGEGLVGLSWAFLRAGAKNVVAGLWDVTDASTASLMADFYAQMVQKLPPANALRAAKLHLLRSPGANRKPFYWGPFELYAGAPI